MTEIFSPQPIQQELAEDPPKKDVDRLVFIVILILTFLAAARSPIDSDLWWHLRAGQETWASGRPLLTDIFSFTQYGQPWVNHSWLSEVILYLVYRWAGYLGLGGLVAMTATLCVAVVYQMMDGPALLKALLVVPGILVAAWVWTPRPQLFSQLLVAILCFILYLYKWKHKDRLWILPFLFLLWSNLHGGYPLGFLLIGFVLLGELMNHLMGLREDGVVPWRGLGKLTILTIVSFLIVVINPNGIDMWKVPFQTVDASIVRISISEWASPDFHDLAQQPFIWLLFAIFFAAGLTKRHMDGADFFSVAGFGYLSLYSRRAFGPFALVALPVLARYAWLSICEWRQRVGLDERWRTLTKTIKLPTRAQSQPPKRVRMAINLCLVGLLGLAAMIKLAAVTYPGWIDFNIRKSYPVAAMEILQSYADSKNVLNEYNWGGFHILETPENKVFIDGRTDLYYKDHILEKWMTLMQAGNGWEEIIKGLNLDWVLVQPDRPLVKELGKLGWKIIYQDDLSVLLKRQ